MAVVGMAANPSGAHQAGCHRAGQILPRHAWGKAKGMCCWAARPLMFFGAQLWNPTLYRRQQQRRRRQVAGLRPLIVTFVRAYAFSSRIRSVPDARPIVPAVPF